MAKSSYFRPPFWSRPLPDEPETQSLETSGAARTAVAEHPTPAGTAAEPAEPLPVRRRAVDTPREVPAETQEFLTTKEAARFLGNIISHRSLERMRLDGSGPPYFRPGGAGRKRGRVLYRKSDLIAWLTAHRYRSTSEYNR